MCSCRNTVEIGNHTLRDTVEIGGNYRTKSERTTFYHMLLDTVEKNWEILVSLGDTVVIGGNCHNKNVPQNKERLGSSFVKKLRFRLW